MQRIIQRRLIARNKALKSSRRNIDKQATEAKRNTRQETFFKERVDRSAIKVERAHRREDWMLGPLAPNRAAGKDGADYGLLNPKFITAPVVPPAEREEYFNFAVNDRVVVVKGREKGKIARIRAIEETRQTVELIGVNEADVQIPSYMLEENAEQIPYRPYSVPLRIQDVRLVVPIRDMMSGKITDTVIEHLRGGKPIVEPPYGADSPKHTRYIGGSQTSIPWPEAEMREFQAEEADTLRLHVNQESFVPSIQNLMVPDSVLDELRSKYSKTRPVVFQQDVQQKMSDDAKEHWRTRRRMVLPQQEYWEQRAKQKSQQSQPEVTKETLDLIEEVRAANQGRISQGVVSQSS